MTVSVQRVDTVAGKSEALATTTKKWRETSIQSSHGDYKRAGNGHGVNLLVVYSIQLAKDTEVSFNNILNIHFCELN